MAVGFFNPSAFFSVNGEVQTENHSTSYERAQSLKSDGDEGRSLLYGGRDSLTQSFRIYDDEIDLSPIVPGTVMDGYHVDTVTVNYTSTDWPEIQVSAHKHLSGNASHGTPHRKAAQTLTLPGGFGACGLQTLAGITDASIGASGGTYTLGITHQDETGCSGGYLASENRDPVETLVINFVGYATPDVSSGKPLNGWDMRDISKDRGNTAAETSSFTFEKHGASVDPGSSSGT